MTLMAQPYIDARKWEAHERRCALLHFDDLAVLFTASWGDPSEQLVRRPDGGYRREYIVHLAVPPEHKERSFQQVRSVTLCLSDERFPLTTMDIERVRSGVTDGVTLVMYIGDWH
jgi:hypothetical protein